MACLDVQVQTQGGRLMLYEMPLHPRLHLMEVLERERGSMFAVRAGRSVVAAALRSCQSINI